TTADFDHDGNPDLAVTHRSGGSAGGFFPPEVVALLGNGTGGIRARFPMEIDGSDGSWIGAGDFTGDGIADLVGNSSLLAGHGDGSFAPPTFFMGGETGAIADFDGNGLPDVATVHDQVPGSVTVTLNNARGALDPAVVAGGIGATHLTSGDFNADGVSDLAAGFRDSGEVGLLLGHGDGSFSPQPRSQIVPPVAPPQFLSEIIGVAAGDFNGDGKQDLAAFSISYFNSTVHLLEGTGDGILLPPLGTPVSTPSAFHLKPVVSDFNADGRQDLAYVG